MEPLPFPPLPIEITRLIFETAALHYEEQALVDLNLTLVSRAVREWVEPIFFYSLIFRSKEELDQRMKVNSPYLLATRAIRLSFYLDPKMDVLSSLFANCSGVVYIADWGNSYLDFTGTALLHNPPIHLRSLSVYFEKINRPDFTPIHFRNLTHLELCDLPSEWSRWNWAGISLESLDSLTHFATNLYNESEDVISISALVISAIGEVLLRCANLQICVLLMSREQPQIQAHFEKAMEDARLAVIPLETEDAEAEWDAHVRGEYCFWDKAKEITERRTKNSKRVRVIGGAT